MTVIKNHIIQQFKEFALNNNIPLFEGEYIRGSTPYLSYSVSYNHIMAKFIADLTGINFSFMKQYMSANQLLTLIKGQEVFDVRIELAVDKDNLAIYFLNFDKSIGDDAYLFVSYIGEDSESILSLKSYNGSTYLSLVTVNDYELSYQYVLDDIVRKLDPNIKTFKKILDISSQSNVDYLNKRLIDADFKVVSFEDIENRYLIENSKIFPFEMTVGFDYKQFHSFLDDTFSKKSASVLKNIISLATFQKKILGRHINWAPHVISDISVTFRKISKYTPYNQIYTINFGVCSAYDCRYTIFFEDDGSIVCHLNDDPIMDLESIYNYIKEDFISTMETCLDIHREYIRLEHLKLYEIMTYH